MVFEKMESVQFHFRKKDFPALVNSMITLFDLVSSRTHAHNFQSNNVEEKAVLEQYRRRAN